MIMRKYIALFAASVLLFFCGCDSGGCNHSAPGGGRGNGSGEGGSGAGDNSHSHGRGAGSGSEKGSGSGAGGSGGGSEKGSGSGAGGSGGGSEKGSGGGSEKGSGNGSKKGPGNGPGGGQNGDDDGVDDNPGGGRGNRGGRNNRNRRFGRNPPEPSEQRLWTMLNEEIRRLAVARSVTFAPLGSPGTSLEARGKKHPGKLYGFSGRCVVVDTDGRRRAYSFSGEMKANNYDLVIMDIRFSGAGS